MLPIDWNYAIRYANLVAIAESLAPNAGYTSAVTDEIATAGYQFLQPIYGDDLATDVNPHLGDLVTFGFVAQSATNELVVAIRGTDTIWEWLHDASFLMVPDCIAGTHGPTEDGFSGVYRSLRTGATNDSPTVCGWIKGYLASGGATSVTICGHSLGGALATLLALDVAINTQCRSPTAYTYASPRVGDHVFAGSYNAAVPSTYRIANRQDIVPKVPPLLPLPYDHVNTEYELNPPMGSIATSIPCMHHLTTYLWLMGQQVGENPFVLNAECKPVAAAGAAPP
jgi:hypothetical protein